jgi:hypothetical protein
MPRGSQGTLDGARLLDRRLARVWLRPSDRRAPAHPRRPARPRRPRTTEIEQRRIVPLDTLESEVDRAQQAVAEARRRHAALQTSQWATYRREYERYLSIEEDGEPRRRFSGRRCAQRLPATGRLPRCRRWPVGVELRRAWRSDLVHQAFPQPHLPRRRCAGKRADQGKEAGALRRVRSTSPRHPSRDGPAHHFRRQPRRAFSVSARSTTR